jgi:hypothetical protein
MENEVVAPDTVETQHPKPQLSKHPKQSRKAEPTRFVRH